MTALLALIPAKLWLTLAAVVAVLAVLGGGYLYVTHNAAENAVNQVAVEAAQQGEKTRHEAVAAASDAERTGSGELLKRGDF